MGQDPTALAQLMLLQPALANLLALQGGPQAAAPQVSTPDRGRLHCLDSQGAQRLRRCLTSAQLGKFRVQLGQLCCKLHRLRCTAPDTCPCGCL